MPHPSGAPTAADHASETTTASATTTVDTAEPRDHQRTHRDTKGLAFVTSRRPEDVETYIGTPYKKNTVAKYPHKNSRIENFSYADLQKRGSRPPSPSPSPSPTIPPLDIYHGPNTAATPITAPTPTAWTDVDTTPIAAPTNVARGDITLSNLMVMMKKCFVEHQ